MAVDGLRYAAAGQVATITIDREAKRNALAPRHFEAIVEGLRKADADENIRVVVLTGVGEKAFCAGADLSSEAGFHASVVGGRTTGLGDILRVARLLTKPLVARVNGPCYAGGVGLLAACDLVVAAENARIALPEVRHGLFPYVVLAGWRARLPAHALATLALTCEPISAVEACRAGIVSSVVPAAALDQATASAVVRLAALPFGIFPAARRILSLLDDAAFEENLALAEKETRALSMRVAIQEPSANRHR